MSRRKTYNLLKLLKYVSLTSTLSIFILIVFGSIIRANGTEGACVQWPLCFGISSLPQDFNTTAAYYHRALTFFVGIFQILLVIIAYLQFRFGRIALIYYLSAVLMLVQVFIGRTLSTSLSEAIPSWISPAHLGVSLIIFAFMVFATLHIFSKGYGKFKLSFDIRNSIVSVVVIISFLSLFMSGAVISRSGIRPICTSWPFCNGLIIPNSYLEWLDITHRLAVLISGFLLLLLLTKAWKSQRSNPLNIVSITGAFVLFLSQALLASQMVGEYPVYLLVLHQSTALAVFATLIAHFYSTCLADFEYSHNAQVNHPDIVSFIGKMKDLFLLTKPIVVALLLVTTYAGMVIGAEKLPSLRLTFWTLLGGFMAAGGSGAINQYIDRVDDTKMQRTQKRPIPAGRLTPAEGLAFGIAMSIGSFYIMVGLINLPAAILTMTGIIYYVLIYSILLKKSTVQNIVIGGGAGAIPPLVGWAASTGSINIPSLFLFAIVFMWTPPHFWALALVRRKDYARAGVPMLPVVRGEKETRWQIFLYTLELFGLTILLPIFGLGGSIYLIGAVVLGLWLLSAAWRVWKQGGNKSAWKMYRYSSMYLAFLFMTLMLDALI